MKTVVLKVLAASCPWPKGLFSVVVPGPLQIHFNKGPFCHFSSQALYLWLLYGMKSFLGYPRHQILESSRTTWKNTFNTCRELLTPASMPPFSCIFRCHIWNIWLTYNFVWKYFVTAFSDFENMCQYFWLNHKKDCKNIETVTLARSAVCRPSPQQHTKVILEKHPCPFWFHFTVLLPIASTCKKRSWRFILTLTSSCSCLQYTYLKGWKAPLLPRRAPTALF